MEAESLMLT